MNYTQSHNLITTCLNIKTAITKKAVNIKQKSESRVNYILNPKQFNDTFFPLFLHTHVPLPITTNNYICIDVDLSK